MIKDLFANRRTRCTSEAEGVHRSKALGLLKKAAPDAPDARFSVRAGEDGAPAGDMVKKPLLFRKKKMRNVTRCTYNSLNNHFINKVKLNGSLTTQENNEALAPSDRSRASWVESDSTGVINGYVQNRASGASHRIKPLQDNGLSDEPADASDVHRVHQVGRDWIDDEFDVLLRDIKTRTDEPIAW